MAHDPDLLNHLEALVAVRWVGTVFRYTAGRRGPEQENSMGARWNPREVAAIYTALDRATVLAEFEYHLSALSPMPRREAFTLYSLSIEVENVVDLREPALLSKLGITDEDLCADDHLACRRVGGAANWLRLGGLIVPSARRPNGSNLVIFPHQQNSEFRLDILSHGPMEVADRTPNATDEDIAR